MSKIKQKVKKFLWSLVLCLISAVALYLNATLVSAICIVLAGIRLVFFELFPMMSFVFIYKKANLLQERKGIYETATRLIAQASKSIIVVSSLKNEELFLSYQEDYVRKYYITLWRTVYLHDIEFTRYADLNDDEKQDESLSFLMASSERPKSIVTIIPTSSPIEVLIVDEKAVLVGLPSGTTGQGSAQNIKGFLSKDKNIITHIKAWLTDYHDGSAELKNIEQFFKYFDISNDNDIAPSSFKHLKKWSYRVNSPATMNKDTFSQVEDYANACQNIDNSISALMSELQRLKIINNLQDPIDILDVGGAKSTTVKYILKDLESRNYLNVKAASLDLALHPEFDSAQNNIQGNKLHSSLLNLQNTNNKHKSFEGDYFKTYLSMLKIKRKKTFNSSLNFDKHDQYDMIFLEGNTFDYFIGTSHKVLAIIILSYITKPGGVVIFSFSDLSESKRVDGNIQTQQQSIALQGIKSSGNFWEFKNKQIKMKEEKSFLIHLTEEEDLDKMMKTVGFTRLTIPIKSLSSPDDREGCKLLAYQKEKL